MPPKKKVKDSIQTKLNFRPISSPTALFSVETSAPLRSHMSILNSRDPAMRTPASTPSSIHAILPSPLLKENTTPGSFDSTTDRKKIGGNSSLSPIRIDTDLSITKDLSSPMSRTSIESPQVFRPAAAVSVAHTLDRGHSDRNTITTGTLELNVNEIVMQDNNRKRKERDGEVSHQDGQGSSFKPVDLDSESDDDLLVMPGTTSAVMLKPQVKSSLPPSTPKPMSLLDQMATPKGTQPMPRATETLSRASSSSSLNGRSIDRPILVSSNSIISDHGFTSAASLDGRMQSRYGSTEPEMTPPFHSGSQPSRSQPTQPYNSLQSKVKSYSQKRSGDFASASSLGLTSTTSTTGTTAKRTLPSTISRYQPTPAQPSPYSRGSGAAPLSLATSFSNAQQKAQARSRSSSPINSSSGAKVNYPANMTRDGMTLSEEQQHVLEQVVLYQRSLFFTGSAGTGKSVLLRELIVQLRKKYNKAKGDYWEPSNDAVAVCASTGIAACNIGGCTLHSFAGVGLGQEALPALMARVRKNTTTVRRWQETKVLIVDEVSMIDAEFLDKLEAVAREVRRDTRPWGGMQVVLVGDFFQLPPVNKGGNVKFCFEGESWKRTITSTIQLRQVFRQKDQSFADMLNEMRLGMMTPGTIAQFKKLTRELKNIDGLRPTELFPMRNQVEEANNRMLTSLPGKAMVFHARDRGPMKEKMEQNCLAPTVLQLKVNSQVMLLRNQSGGAGGLVNGSLGVLVGFVNRPADNENLTSSTGERNAVLNTPGEELPLVRFTLEDGKTREMVVGREEWKIELPNGTLQGARVQVPLSLAWSLSIHKSQGQTLPKVKVDLARVFEKGQAYVALSRATTLEGLQVLNFDPRKVMVHPKVTEFYNNLQVYDGVGSSRRIEGESAPDKATVSEPNLWRTSSATVSTTSYSATSSTPGRASAQISKSFYK